MNVISCCANTLCWLWQLGWSQSPNPCADTLHQFPCSTGATGTWFETLPPLSCPARAQRAPSWHCGVHAAAKWRVNIPIRHSAEAQRADKKQSPQCRRFSPCSYLHHCLVQPSNEFWAVTCPWKIFSHFIYFFSLIILHSFFPSVNCAEKKWDGGTSLPSLPSSPGIPAAALQWGGDHHPRAELRV